MTGFLFKHFSKGLLKEIFSSYDQLEWYFFEGKKGAFQYYQTQLGNLSVRVGYDFDRDLYYLFVEKIGRVHDCTPRRWLPARWAQRAYNLIRIHTKGNIKKQYAEENKD